MKKFVKIISETEIEFAPNFKNGIANYNYNEKLMKSDGFKPLVTAEYPIDDRKYNLVYSENDSSVIENIVYLETEESYQNRKNNEILQQEIDSLITNIQDLDFKRIRALCEPSIKDEETGETWLDYYNTQISDLRNQLQTLQERII